jgi:hypothetical protein
MKRNEDYLCFLLVVVILVEMATALVQTPYSLQALSSVSSHIVHINHRTTTSRRRILPFLLFSSSSDMNKNNRPDLVDQSIFIAAIERVEDEIAMTMEKQKQQLWQQELKEAEPSSPQQQPSQPQDEENMDENNSNNNNIVYAIGRIFADLPIDQQPELDLTESIGPLVLVTGVWGQTAEISGLQIYDTITKVTVKREPSSSSFSTAATATTVVTNIGEELSDGSSSTSTLAEITFAASCKQSTLEETAAILTAAASHAREHNTTKIQLEVNRLIQGYYAAPTPQSPSPTEQQQQQQQ